MSANNQEVGNGILKLKEKIGMRRNQGGGKRMHIHDNEYAMLDGDNTHVTSNTAVPIANIVEAVENNKYHQELPLAVDELPSTNTLVSGGDEMNGYRALEVSHATEDTKKSWLDKLKLRRRSCICIAIASVIIVLSIILGTLKALGILDTGESALTPTAKPSGGLVVTSTPTISPSKAPSTKPSISPATKLPTSTPTTISPFKAPSSSPTTKAPSETPSTTSPSNAPSRSPTIPTKPPSLPTNSPTAAPTPIPQWSQLKIASADQYGKNDGRMCLDAIPGAPYQVHIVPCWNGANQKFWHYNGMIRLQYQQDHCLTSSSSIVYFSPCAGTSDQLWDEIDGAFRLRNDHSLCLDFDYTEERVYVTGCNGGWNQNFKWDNSPAPAAEYFSLKLSGSRDNICLEVETGGDYKLFFGTCNGSDQQLFTLFSGTLKSKFDNNNSIMTYVDGQSSVYYRQYEHYNLKQKWYFDGDSLVNSYNRDKCLTFNYDTLEATTTTCSSAWNQLFSRDYTNTVPIQYRKLRIQSSNLCAEVDTASPNKLHAVICRPGDRQLFELRVDGTLRSKYDPSKCIDYNWSNFDVYMFGCNGGTNQKWKFINGKLTTYRDGNCADYNPNTNFGEIYMFTCHDGWNQKFEWAVLYDVTCQFTVDNQLSEMWLNGVEITSLVSGDFENWEAAKTANFAVSSSIPQIIAIKGFDWEAAGSAALSGLMLKCTSSDLPKWNFSSKLDGTWKGYSSSTSSFPSQWYYGITSVDSKSLVQSTSGFYLPGVSMDANDKIWVEGTDRYAGFVKVIYK